jgi:hypothetical protein
MYLPRRGYAAWIKLVKLYSQLASFARQKIYGSLAILAPYAAHFNLVFAGRQNQKHGSLADDFSINPDLRFHRKRSKKQLAGVLTSLGLERLSVRVLGGWTGGQDQMGR